MADIDVPPPCIALCGLCAVGVLVILAGQTAELSATSNGPPGLGPLDDADGAPDVVPVQKRLTSLAPPPPPLGKAVYATRMRVRGQDYACDDHDGPAADACQIRCGAPCVEPFRLCHAHAQCHAVSLNPEGTYATLKTGLGASLSWFGDAKIVHSVAEWRSWIATSAARRGARLAGRPDALRTVRLALGPIDGGDFACGDSDGGDAASCQVRCASHADDGSCVDAWRRCLAHHECAVVAFNDQATWATLKTGVLNGASLPLVSIADEAAWRAAYERRQTGARLQNPAAAGHDDSNATTAAWQAALAKAATAEAQAAAGADRPILLTLEDVRRHDFACSEHEGTAADACQVRCGPEKGCERAYRRCLAHRSECVAIYVNADRSFGTLKSAVTDGHDVVLVLSEEEWGRAVRGHRGRAAVAPPLSIGPPHGQALVPDGPTRHGRWARERHEFRRRRKGWLFG